MKIAIGCDPNAQAAKEEVIAYIAKKGYGEVTDFGSEDPIYANVAIAVGEAVAAKKYDRGILICGTGIGISVAANKVPGVIAAVCSEPYSAKLTKQHNNANVIAFGARVVGVELAKMILDEFFGAEFEGGRHQARVDMIHGIEADYSK